MANYDHIRWLLEGVESWNARRLQKPFNPDLSEGNIAVFLVIPDSGDMNYIPLDGANLRDADLTGADLNNISLLAADLSRADLSTANLQHANLTKANLEDANLTGARFWRTNLTKAKLLRTTLTQTRLWQANLSHADLRDVDLTNAVLTGAEPWNAYLYPSSNISPDQLQDRSTPIKSIEDLLALIRELKTLHPSALFYFRGEYESGWDLCPSVMRDSFISSERDMLVDLISRRPGEFNVVTSALAQWVIAQHHGLRTRFLDITKNPLVALFHACEVRTTEAGCIHIFAAPKGLVKPFNSDAVSVIANFAKLSQHDQEAVLGKRNCSCHGSIIFLDEYTGAKRRLYQLIRQEEPYFEERIDPRDLYRVFVVEPQQSSERIRAQSGAFLVSAFHERFEREEILTWNADIPVYAHYQLTIPANSKEVIMNDLELLNVTRETLFPGLDESAKAVIESHRPQQQVT